MGKNKNINTSSSLYVDVAVILGSVFVLAVISYYLWLPNLMQELDDENSLPYLKELVKTTLLYVYVPFVVSCFVLGELTQNFSQVDKIWSIITPVFCWYITWFDAHQHNMEYNYKLLLMSTLVTIWGVRLSYQFFCKGGYSWKFWTGEEDYRWEIVRERMPIIFSNRILFTLFNLGFICLYQLLLLFLITAGVMISAMMADQAALHQRDIVTLKDKVVASLVLLCILFEIVADHHQQLFQREKYRRMKEKIPLKCSQNNYQIGFNINGLFAYSRHPNFTAEQAIWFVFYFFSVNFDSAHNLPIYNIGGVFNVSITGAILLIIMFAKSTNLTEDISTRKYPLYKKYQQNVGRILDLKLIFRKILFGENPRVEWLKE